LTTALALGGAGSASAGSVKVVADDNNGEAPLVHYVLFADTAGERNNLRITVNSDRSTTITELHARGHIAPAGTCRRGPAANAVVCPAADGLVVKLGDGNDSVRVTRAGAPATTFFTYLWGDAGNDVLSGGGGHEELWGGPGADVLRAAAGDAAYCGAGADRLLGGAVLAAVSGCEFIAPA
jgi:Ca2+-binding RTX toxin-like protein